MHLGLDRTQFRALEKVVLETKVLGRNRVWTENHTPARAHVTRPEQYIESVMELKGSEIIQEHS
ncbi:MAG: hypothetical protein Q9215_004862 [Flavoplaca cf. flavocitrina]